MPAQLTSGLPGHTPTRSGDAPADDPARDFWVLLGHLAATGLPAPQQVSVNTDRMVANLTLSQAAHVARWAVAVAAPTPYVHSHCPDNAPLRRLTSTRTECTLACGLWLSVDHLHVENLDPTEVDPTDPTDSVTLGVETGAETGTAGVSS